MAWLYCPVCGKEREMTGKGNMMTHNRPDETNRNMVHCEGSGRPGQKMPPRKK
jgi:hypothetical protein